MKLKTLSRPIISTYYVTYRCNSKCVFCNIWNHPLDKLTHHTESSTEEVISHLHMMKRLGVKVVDFTGGEPLLRRDLGALCRAAKDIGLKVQFTTDCILYPRRAREFVGVVDMLNFSLCAPNAEDHNRIRGIDCFDAVMQSIDISTSLGHTPTILFTVNDENIHHVPAMIKMAREKDCMLKVQLVFGYFGNEEMDTSFLDELKKYMWEPNVFINPAEVEFYRKGNDIKNTRCYAVESNLVISPDGYILLPCYHAVAEKVKIDRELTDIWLGKEVQDMRAKQGKYDFCAGCRNVCYMFPSFFYEFDKFFIYNTIAGTKFLYEKYVRLQGKNKLSAASYALSRGLPLDQQMQGGIVEHESTPEDQKAARKNLLKQLKVLDGPKPTLTPEVAHKH